MPDLTMEVLEVDQWTSTGDLSESAWARLKSQGIEAVNGGDSAAARAIFGGHFSFRTITPADNPRIGTVWFREGADGKAELYRSNYDSSD